MSTANLTVASGSLAGTGTLSVTGVFNWSGGNLTSAGVTRVEAGGTLAISGAGTKLISARTLEVGGAATWDQGTISAGSGAAIGNLPTGTFDASGTASMAYNLSGALPTFDNQGTLRRVGSGVTTIDAVFTNSGSVDIQGGPLELARGSVSTGSFLVSALDVLALDAGIHDFHTGSAVTGAGHVTLGAGAATFAGSYGITGITTVAGGIATFSTPTAATTGGLTVSGGTLDVLGTLAPSGAVALASGTILQGTGTLDLSGAVLLGLNGDVNPGTSPGILGIVAPLAGITQPVGATWTLELDGPVPGTGHDRIDITGGAVTFLGTLDIVTNVRAAPGDIFTAITYTSRGAGTLAGVNGLDLGGIMLDTAWAAAQLDVIAQPSVIFAGDSAGGLSSGIFRLHPNGALQVNVTPEGPPAELLVHPRWSPDRTRITYAARPGFGPNQLHIATADGSVISHPTSATDTSTFRPRFNPTGNRIAFECGDGVGPDDDVCTIADVSGPVALLDGIGDGAGKLFLSDLATPFTIGPPAFAWNPASPDFLAFFRDSVTGQGDTVSHLFTARYDGTAVVNQPPGGMDIGNGPLRVEGTIDWSPDGTLIAFAAREPGQFDTDIFVIGPTGTGLRRVALQGATPLLQPVFSPDNLAILFAAFIDGFAIFQVPTSATDALGTGMTPLFNYSFSLAGYDWSPDGTEIVLNDDALAGHAGRAIVKILRTTVTGTYTRDAVIIGRRSAVFSEVVDNQPSWRH